MNTNLSNMQFYKVCNLESCTENTYVGGSIPPLGTINLYSFYLLRVFNSSSTLSSKLLLSVKASFTHA